jgi:hypothetical protein
MPSTFVHGLLPASCVYTYHRRFPTLTRRQRAILVFLAAVIGNLPDLDILPTLFFPEHWQEIHRWWGHNLFSITLWIIMGAYSLNYLVSPHFKGWRGYLLSALLVFSHVCFDAMADFNPEGIRPGVPLLWPLSNWQFHLPFRLFKPAITDPHLNPLFAYATSRNYWTEAIYSEIFSTLLLLGIWFAFVSLYSILQKRFPGGFGRPSPVSPSEN